MLYRAQADPVSGDVPLRDASLTVQVGHAASVPVPDISIDTVHCDRSYRRR